MSIQLVCLDLAGTTVRDDGAVTAAFADALAEVGVEPGTPEHAAGLAYAEQTMGQSKIEVFRALFGGADADAETRVRRANERFEKSYASSLAGGVAPIDGAAEAIGALRDSGVRVALTTGFSPTTRDALLAELGWSAIADLVLSPADAGRGRPHPDMLLVALLRLEIEGVGALAAVGDTTSDLIAGTRAGASIVAGVLTGAHGESDFAGVPHTHVLASVAELPALVAEHDHP